MSERIGTLMIMFLLSLSLFSCGGKREASSALPNKDKIKVGMTYDEVEKLLGKPSQISRGANELKVDDITIRTGTEKDIELQEKELEFKKAIAETTKSQNMWLFPRVVGVVGQLIYVNWLYPETSADTNFIWCRNYVTKIDTFLQPQTRYIVNGQVVTKWKFDEFEQYKDRMWSDRKKEIIYVKKVREHELEKEPTKKFFIVRKVYCVLFDASSGRVVQCGFQPVAVHEYQFE